MRSRPMNPACPSFAWKTAGARPSARKARTPPMPSTISWRSRCSASSPYSRSVMPRRCGGFSGTSVSSRYRSTRPTRAGAGPLLALPAVAEPLAEVPAVPRADGDHRHAEVAGRLLDATGKRPQAAGVRAKRRRDAMFHAEVRHRRPYRRTGQVAGEVVFGRLQLLSEEAVRGQLGQPLGRSRADHREGIAGAVPQRGVHGSEHAPGGLVPNPSVVARQRLKGSQQAGLSHVRPPLRCRRRSARLNVIGFTSVQPAENKPGERFLLGLQRGWRDLREADEVDQDRHAVLLYTELAAVAGDECLVAEAGDVLAGIGGPVGRVEGGRVRARRNVDVHRVGATRLYEQATLLAAGAGRLAGVELFVEARSDVRRRRKRASVGRTTRRGRRARA